VLVARTPFAVLGITPRWSTVRAAGYAWDEEWLANLEDLPGRLVKVLWALSIVLVGAGRMGRMLRGAPPMSQILRARIRAAWQKLRLRRRPPLETPDESTTAPSAQKVEAHPAIVATEAQPAKVSTIPAFRLGASSFGYAVLAPDGAPLGWASAVPLLTPKQEFEEWFGQQEFENYLAEKRREFDEYLAQQRREFDEYLAQRELGFISKSAFCGFGPGRGASGSYPGSRR
jgi:hypothetical protein